MKTHFVFCFFIFLIFPHWWLRKTYHEFSREWMILKLFTKRLMHLWCHASWTCLVFLFYPWFGGVIVPHYYFYIAGSQLSNRCLRVLPVQDLVSTVLRQKSKSNKTVNAKRNVEQSNSVFTNQVHCRIFQWISRLNTKSDWLNQIWICVAFKSRNSAV